jgi:ribonuclease Y
MERLISDGRIHPSRIEEALKKASDEIDEEMKKAGEEAAYTIGVAGINQELVKLLGRLKFRTSYGQNVLKHSIEVAQIAGLLAEELGADVTVCKRAGLFHDIGKAVDHEVSGSHATISKEILEKYKVDETLESYVKRIQELEETANSFKGVEKCYAIQAGREVRILVKPEVIDDLESIKLSRNIAKKIEKELNYPGQIKVNVIRETRSVEFAK